MHGALTRWISDFDANGVLDMYAMHLVSTDQLRELLGPSPIARGLDVGAGSGDVTRALAPLVDDLHTTERSRAMVWRLRRQGFACEARDLAVQPPDVAYDLITCFNVLDRAARPLTLLRHLVDSLEVGGRLLIATPLPYAPFYYDGPRTPSPLEPLPSPGATWEAAANTLTARVLEPAGLEVVALSRCPYLSAGDAGTALYPIDDGLLLCQRR